MVLFCTIQCLIFLSSHLCFLMTINQQKQSFILNYCTWLGGKITFNNTDVGWTYWHLGELSWTINMHNDSITYSMWHHLWWLAFFYERWILNGRVFLLLSLTWSVTVTAALGSALRRKRVDLFLMIKMYLSGSEQWLVFLHPLLHTEVWEEETDFSLCWLNRI